MNIQTKGMLFLILSTSLLFFGCNEKSGQGGIKKETIRIMSNVVGGKTIEEQEIFVKALSDAFGMNIEMTKPASGYDDVLLQTLASGEKYDIIYMTYSDKFKSLIEQKALVDLTDIISKSPVLSDPSTIPQAELELYRAENNKLYGVPVKLEGGRLAIARDDWLKKFNLADPVTLSDWEHFWKMAKEEYGAYGLSFAKELYDIQPWASAWGLKDGYKIEKGERSIPWASEASIPMWEWLNRMYKNEFLDPNFETNGTGEVRNLFFNDQLATLGYWDAWVSLFNMAESERYEHGDFIARGLNAVPSSEGEYFLSRGDSSLWAIPANAPNIKAAIRFLEFWHSEPAYLLGSLGVEGYDYTVENNVYTLTDIGKEHNLDHGAPRVMSTIWRSPFPPSSELKEAQAIVMEHAIPVLKTSYWEQASKILRYWGFKAIKGEISATDAVQSMQQELHENDLID